MGSAKKKKFNQEGAFDGNDEDEQELIECAQLLPRAARATLEQHSRPAAKRLESIQIKGDHAKRPLWIQADGTIFMEASIKCTSNLKKAIQEFLTAIAEPVSRPTHIHTYKLTAYSLYAASSLGLHTEDILRILQKLCKHEPVPKQVCDFVRACTGSFGVVRLLLGRSGEYWLESDDVGVLQCLLRDPEISLCRAKGDGVENSKAHASSNTADTATRNSNTIHALLDLDLDNDLASVSGGAMAATTEAAQSHSFQVAAECIERVKKRCIQLDYPLLEEYDYAKDDHLKTLSLHLRPSVQLRPYQEASLSKMFGAGRARSGIIVLPCGAGKTLVGIVAASTVKKRTLVLCTSGVAVEQWRQQFLAFTNIPDASIARFTSECKERLEDDGAGIVISTYSMIAYGGKRSWEAKRMMGLVQASEWGLMILDEVHVVPANVFRRVLLSVAAHCKLGLTATLVREDEKIDDLNFLIGPKLYEANWMQLAQEGHIARVQCAEVWCSVTAEFYRSYLQEESHAKRRLLAIMNPQKIQTCQYLIEYHEARGDKIIVFSDNVWALRTYALKLGKAHIWGGTGQQERMHILNLFQSHPKVNTLFLSKVGDTSIDLPEATCLIQISSHYGSRRQEAQRLGRILRAKRRSDHQFNAYFYSLVSRDTEECWYGGKRQQFLVDQGYAFKIITELPGMQPPAKRTEAANASAKKDAILPEPTNANNGSGGADGGKHFHPVYESTREQIELLQTVLLTSQQDTQDELLDDLDGQYSSSEDEEKARDRVRAWSTGDRGGIADMSGGCDGMAYVESRRAVHSSVFSTNAGGSGGSGSRERHPLFKSRYSKK